MAGGLTGLPNIGKAIAAQLEAVGIVTPEQLAEAGSREAFLRLKAAGYDPCLSCLQGLEGAIRGIRWHHLEPGVKAELHSFFRENGNGRQ